jgi:hypothetical protein
MPNICFNGQILSSELMTILTNSINIGNMVTGQIIHFYNGSKNELFETLNPKKEINIMNRRGRF